MQTLGRACGIIMKNFTILGILLFSFPLISLTAERGPAEFAVTITVDAAKPIGELRPIWRYFGHDEPNYTYMRDGKKLLGQIAEAMPYPAYMRTHNLITSGDGTPALK